MIATSYILFFILINFLLALAVIIRKNSLVIFLIVLSLILFSGFRYNAGIDYFSYMAFIQSSYDLKFIEPISRLILLFARESEAPWIFFLVHSFIYIFLMTYVLRKLNHLTPFTLYIFTFFTLSYITSFGFVRQFTAIGIMFLAFYNLYYGNKKRFILLTIIASGFHTASLIYLILLFFKKILLLNYPFIVYLTALIIAYFLSSFLLSLLIHSGIDFLYLHYLTEFSFGVSGKKIYYSLILLFFVGKFMVYVCNLNDENTELLIFSQNMFFLGLLIYTLLFDYGEHLARFSYYLMPFMVVWLSSIYKLLRRRNNKIIFASLIYLLGVFYYFATLYFATLGSKDFLNGIEFYFINQF